MSSDTYPLETKVTTNHRRDTLLHIPDLGCWFFFLDYQERLACRYAKTAGGEWTKEELLAGDKVDFWWAAQDQSGQMHVVFNDNDGLLWHLNKKHPTWSKAPIAAFSPTGHRKPLYLRKYRGGLELIAAILGEPKETACLKLYRFEKEQWLDLGSLPISPLINSISMLEQWQIGMDSKHLVHCLFPDMESGAARLYYQECLALRQNTIKSIQLSSNWRSDMGSSLVIDQNDILHILWVEGKTKELKYRRKQPGGWPSGGWQPEQCLTTWAENYLPPILMAQGDLLLAAWQQGKQIYGCLSHDNGVTWDCSSSFPGIQNAAVLRFISGSASGEPKGFNAFALGDMPGSILSPALFLSPPDFLLAGPPAEPAEIDQPIQPEEPPFSEANSGEQAKETPEEKKREIEKEGDLSYFIQQHNDYFQRLIKQVEDLRLANQQLEQELSEKNKELIAANNLARQQEARARILAQQSYSQGEQYKTMESNLKQLKQEYAQMASQLQKSTTQIDSYKEELKLTRDEIRVTSLQLKEKDGEILQLKQRLQTKEQEAMEALRQLTDKTRQLQEADKRLKETESLLQEAQRKINERKPGLLERITRSIQ
ncbi:MAG: hypothetical protein ACOY9Y_07865 [Bacillota bacterium]